MAEVEAAPTFGGELKDGFKPACAWAGHGIAFLDDIQGFYRERSAIEKEYSVKLNALAKKYFEKKTRKSSSLSVGDSPAMTPGSLESASLTTWTTHLTSLEAQAEQHERYGNELITQIADPLKTLAARFEELRRRHGEYADRLEKERDASYVDLRKVKTKYDAVCQEVESKRKKSESAFDKAKAQSAYHQQILDMNNAKNTYIIAINVTNKHKEKYYHEYVPEVMDSLQDLSEFRTIRLNGLWTLASHLENTMLKENSAVVDRLTQEIARNLPHLDSMMYIRHNMGGFQEPPDRAFEPCPVWHDDDAMVVDDQARVYLRNLLNKSKSQLGDLRREVDKKRREVESTKRTKQKIRDGTEQQDEVTVVGSVFSMQEELHQTERKRLTAEVETSTITSAVGDVTLGAKNHNFKSQTFKIPTNCDLCGERIWGLSAKGFDCRDCGYTCHSKCEMKVPSECPGESTKEERKKLKQERQETANALLKPPTGLSDHIADSADLSRSNTMTSLSSGYAARGRKSVSGTFSPPNESPSIPELPAAPVLPAPRLPAPAPGLPAPELPAASVPAPLPRTSAAPASGGGTIRKNRVIAPPPSAYISELPGSTVNGSAPPPEQKGKLLYTFEAGGEGEITVPAGREVIVLEPDSGTGWVKVRAGYKEGLVPSTYVELSASTPAPAIAPQNTGQSARPPSTYSNSGSSIGTSAGMGSKKKGPAVAPRRGAKKLKYVEALYEYTAQGEAEHSMAEGERFVLIKEDLGDGWAEVEKGGVAKSVPASYIQNV